MDILLFRDLLPKLDKVLGRRLLQLQRYQLSRRLGLQLIPWGHLDITQHLLVTFPLHVHLVLQRFWYITRKRNHVDLLIELHGLELGSSSILLVQGILVLAHTLGLLNTVLLALLVPAPLVDLGLCESCLLGDLEESLLRPVRILVKLLQQHAQLVLRLAHSLPDDLLHVARGWIVHVAASLDVVLLSGPTLLVLKLV